MSRIRTVLVILLLLTGVSAGAQVSVTESGELENVDELIADYNGNYAQQLPGLVRSIIANQRINVEISSDTETITYGVVFQGVQVTDWAEGGVNDPTLTVTTSVTTIEAIGQAENPRQRAVQAFKTGEIQYRAVGVWNQLKFGVLSALIKIFG